MIFSLDIDYTQQCPDGFHMVTKEIGEKRDKPRKLLPQHIEFKPGLNLVVGANGSGKTTLLNALWSRSLHSAVSDPGDIYKNLWFNKDLASIFPGYGYKFMADGDNYEEDKFFNIKMDFSSPVHIMKRISDMSNESAMSNMANFCDFFQNTHMSSGEKLIHSIMRMVNLINSGHLDYDLVEELKKARVPEEMISGYIEKHHQDAIDKQRTIIMDEPDAGLDVFGLQFIKQLISNPNVQIIAAVHNPALIMALKDQANVIELTDGYICNLENFIQGKKVKLKRNQRSNRNPKSK